MKNITKVAKKDLILGCKIIPEALKSYDYKALEIGVLSIIEGFGAIQTVQKIKKDKRDRSSLALHANQSSRRGRNDADA